MNLLLVNMKTIRKSWGLGQDKMADVMGVSRSMISQYETAQSKPSTEYLVKLQMLSGLNVQDFITRKISSDEVSEKPLVSNTKIPDPIIVSSEPNLEHFPTLVEQVKDLMERVKALEKGKSGT